MSTSYYKDKNVTIPNLNISGLVTEVFHKRNGSGVLGIRLHVKGDNGKTYECQPHEIKITHATT